MMTGGRVYYEGNLRVQVVLVCVEKVKQEAFWPRSREDEVTPLEERSHHELSPCCQEREHCAECQVPG